MTTTVESIGQLEKRIALSVVLADIEGEVENRLKRLSRTVRIDGFRPGKVPMKIVERQYAGSVRSEVLNDAMQKCISEAVAEHQLKVVGYPSIDAEPLKDGDATLNFTATFEVYPEVKLGDLSQITVERPVHEMSDADVDRTIAILRRQRTTYAAADRAAQDGDQISIDFRGTLDGTVFAGGEGENFVMVLGTGQTLKDFEAPIIGMKAGEEKSFELTFPADYHGQEVAGKTVTFTVKLNQVAAPVEPEINADFIKEFGIDDGSVESFRNEIRTNLTREVGRKVRQLVSQRLMDKLIEATPVEIPKALIDIESRRLMEQTWAQYEQRGLKREQIPLQPELFAEDAKKRAHISLVIGAIIDQNKITASSDQVRAKIEEIAASYEQPEELVNYYYADESRLDQVVNIVMEENVVEWVLGQVKTVDQPTEFDALMGLQS